MVYYMCRAKIRQSPSGTNVARNSSAKKTNCVPRRSASQERKITPQTRRRTRSPSPAGIKIKIAVSAILTAKRSLLEFIYTCFFLKRFETLINCYSNYFLFV